MTSYSYTKAEWFVARRRGLEADETEKKTQMKERTPGAH